MATCNRCGQKVVWAEHHKSGKPMMFDSPPKLQVWAFTKVDNPDGDYDKNICRPVSLYSIHFDTCPAREENQGETKKSEDDPMPF